MRNRCILSLLICGALLYYALPELKLHGSGIATYFAWSWLALLIMAIAGNLAAILYTPKRKKVLTSRVKGNKENMRGYMRG